MALGTVAEKGLWRSIELLATATATNSPPATATAGIAVNDMVKPWPATAFGLNVESSAGSGTMTTTGRLWGKNPTTAVWNPIGPGSAAGKGVINNGAAIAETGADLLRHLEELDTNIVEHCERIYYEVTAIGGTSTAIKVLLTWKVQ